MVALALAANEERPIGRSNGALEEARCERIRLGPSKPHLLCLKSVVHAHNYFDSDDPHGLHQYSRDNYCDLPGAHLLMDPMDVTLLEHLPGDVTTRLREFQSACKAASENPEKLTHRTTLPKEALLSAIGDFERAVRGPFDHITYQLALQNSLIPLHALYSFDIPSKVPLYGDISFQDLAAACDADEDRLRRIVRYGATRGLFKESKEGFVSHTPETVLLANSAFLVDYTGVMCEDFWPSASQVIPSMRKWPASESIQHCGFALTPNSAGGFFDTMSAHPARAARFDRFMKSFSVAPQYSYTHLCDAFDWSATKSMVDLGGGTGGQAVMLAEKYSHLNIITQDLPSLKDAASSHIPAHLSDRVQFQAHDFFEEQPVKSADVYHFRMIFHDWPNADCIRILRALIPALSPKSKVLITEQVLPPPGTVSRTFEWAVRSFDMVMVELNNSLERDEKQWRKLVQDADEHFAMESMKTVEGSAYAHITIG